MGQLMATQGPVYGAPHEKRTVSRRDAIMAWARAVGRLGCLVPVRRFPSPSRSIRFSDVSEANGRGTTRGTHFRTFSHGPRDLTRFGREEK